jgi:hypothetical protein
MKDDDRPMWCANRGSGDLRALLAIFVFGLRSRQ